MASLCRCGERCCLCRFRSIVLPQSPWPAWRRLRIFLATVDGLASGQSAFPCYEPIFGYRLEIFPNKPAPGLLFSASDTTHLRNPACYIYGRENNCAPGDAFTPAQQAEETLFARYHSFAFTLPEWQRWADRLSVSGLAGVLIGLAISRRRKNRRAAGPALKPKIL